MRLGVVPKGAVIILPDGRRAVRMRRKRRRTSVFLDFGLYESYPNDMLVTVCMSPLAASFSCLYNSNHPRKALT